MKLIDHAYNPRSSDFWVRIVTKDGALHLFSSASANSFVLQEGEGLHIEVTAPHPPPSDFALQAAVYRVPPENHTPPGAT